MQLASVKLISWLRPWHGCAPEEVMILGMGLEVVIWVDEAGVDTSFKGIVGTGCLDATGG